jgi:hypothetical protein
MNTANTDSSTSTSTGTDVADVGAPQRREAGCEDVLVPEPTPGRPDELASYQYRAPLIRPVRAAERDASDQTTTVDGTGIFALSLVNMIIRSDDPGCPAVRPACAWYCWVAP